MWAIRHDILNVERRTLYNETIYYAAKNFPWNPHLQHTVVTRVTDEQLTETPEAVVQLIGREIADGLFELWYEEWIQRGAD